MHGYSELTVGDGVLVAPFVGRAALALVAFALLRPLVARLPLDRVFANPPIVELCLYVMLTAMFLVLP